MHYTTQSESQGQGQEKEKSDSSAEKQNAEGENGSAVKKDAAAPPSVEEECQRKLKAKDEEVTDLTVRHPVTLFTPSYLDFRTNYSSSVLSYYRFV